MRDALDERIGILNRREAEARILRPFFEAVAAELGRERAEAVLRRIVQEQALASGRAMRERSEGGGLEAFAEQWEPWFRGGALEIEELERSPGEWRFHVTRCRYAEMYRQLGMEDLGAALSCNRDAALIEGYHPEVRFERSQTLMAGASHCDFRYLWPEAGDPDEA